MYFFFSRLPGPGSGNVVNVPFLPFPAGWWGEKKKEGKKKRKENKNKKWGNWFLDTCLSIVPTHEYDWHWPAMRNCERSFCLERPKEEGEARRNPSHRS
jgi:hypothetical protein